MYGVTVEQFQEMLEFQAGLCAMCCAPMVPGRGTHIDHDHVTGKVRGLLCGTCNTSLGLFEKPMAADDAMAYLQAVESRDSNGEYA